MIFKIFKTVFFQNIPLKDHWTQCSRVVHCESENETIQITTAQKSRMQATKQPMPSTYSFYFTEWRSWNWTFNCIIITWSPGALGTWHDDTTWAMSKSTETNTEYNAKSRDQTTTPSSHLPISQYLPHPPSPPNHLFHPSSLQMASHLSYLWARLTSPGPNEVCRQRCLIRPCAEHLHWQVEILAWLTGDESSGAA